MVLGGNGDASEERTSLGGGKYKITFYRNSSGACKKAEATEAIVHYHDAEGTLVNCEYRRFSGRHPA